VSHTGFLEKASIAARSTRREVEGLGEFAARCATRNLAWIATTPYSTGDYL
jgi:hypothetical protein